MGVGPTFILTCVACVGAVIVPQFSSSNRLTGSSFGIPTINATFDYVIIGGGLAGSVMASRLTERSNATVAIVEGGNFYELNNGNWSQIPYWSEQWAGSEPDDYNPLVDYGLVTEPQLNGQRYHYAQGKCLGGSSARNQMLYQRGTVGFYQAWADQVGDQSFTWDNMTTYLERSMTFTPPGSDLNLNNVSIAYDASAFLSTSNSSNPLQVSYLSYYQPLSTYGPDAFSNIGLSQQPGFSSGVLHGYDYWSFTIDPKTGLRSSAQSSFLDQAFTRNSLTVYLNTLAQNVIFNANKTAVGVNVTSNSAVSGARYYTLSARKEVILSAGAYHSPQILMLSGIGPSSILSQHSIPIISALEGVGQNMTDTANIGGVVNRINPDFTTFASIQDNTSLMAEAQSQFLTNGTGPLTNIGTDFVAWYKIPPNITSTLSNTTQTYLTSLPPDWPELEISLSSTSRSLEFSTSAAKVGSINSLLIAGASRGNMTIRSASIFDKPIISPNWLLDSIDQEIAIAAYRLARVAWRGLPAGVVVGDEVFPGANVTSDADLLAAIKTNIAAIHHVSASCKMGRVDDPGTVVDSRGFVIGVQALRVVDSSTFPFTPPGHTQATTYAHAEKMADAVLGDWIAGGGGSIDGY